MNMKRLMVLVAAVAMMAIGCGGAPFAEVSSADEGHSEIGEAGALSDPPPGVDAGALVNVAPETGAPEAQADEPAVDAGPVAVSDAASKDAGQPEVNKFPGSPYGPASCRGSADCVSDTEFDIYYDGSSTIALVCRAPEDNSNLLVGATQCVPAEDVAHGSVALCLSGLDCGGYACVTQSCSVGTYAPYDGGDIVEVGVASILVSYCQGVGTVPAGCH
jgi:hypothetical protein